LIRVSISSHSKIYCPSHEPNNCILLLLFYFTKKKLNNLFYNILKVLSWKILCIHIFFLFIVYSIISSPATGFIW